MDGSVLRVGWDDRLILALRAKTFGDELGWMLLDTREETLEGPFTEQEFADQLRMRPEVARIRLMGVAAAWDSLR